MTRATLATHHPGTTPDACQRYVDWLARTALPLWAACEHPGGFPFAESLDHDGGHGPETFLRLRVLSRQVAVYSRAASLGLPGAACAAERGWRALVDQYWSTMSGWAALVVPPRKTVDPTFTLYDQAFAVYACACWARFSGDDEPVVLAMRTLALIDRRLKISGYLGWRASPTDACRDQNGHMHYLEALLALEPLVPEFAVRSRIRHILGLFEQHLFDRSAGTIGEQYDLQWMPLGDRIEVEPGHLYEWYWLLARAREQGHAISVDDRLLLSFADRHGWNRKTGLIHDCCDPAGKVVRASHRLWPHCEALRAACERKRRPARHCSAPVIAERIETVFLGMASEGKWMDRVTRDLLPVSGQVPASSLYHLWGAGEALVGAGLAHWPEEAGC